MTTKQLRAEMAYHASMAPFVQLLKGGVVSKEDYEIAKAILTKKYHPIFVGYVPQILLDNSSDQR